MQIVQLTDELHQYLLHVITEYSARGIHPNEGVGISKLWEYANKATHVDESKLERKPEIKPEGETA
jgi:hypothetical protein